MRKLTQQQKEQNEYRADRGGEVINSYRNIHDKGEPDEAVLSDLLTDLMHYCDTEKLYFHDRLATAQMNFNAEKNGED